MLRSLRHAAICPAAALLAVGLLYLLLRQHVFTIDSYYYLWDTEFGSWERLLHPHHLMLQPLQRLWWNLWTWFDWPDRAVLPLQLLSLGLTLAGLAVIWRVLLRVLPGSRGQAAAWWCVVAFSYLTWSQATQADSLPVFSLFAALYLLWAVKLVQDGPPDRRSALTLAVVMTGGVLAHQMLVLVTPLLTWMLWREAHRERRRALAALALGTAGAATLAIYLVAGIAATGQASPTGLLGWFLGYSEEFAGRYGSLANMISLETPRGLASAFLTGDPLKPFLYGDRGLGPESLLVGAPFVVLLAFLMHRFVGLVRGWPQLSSAERRVTTNLALLAGLTVLFASWWDPGQRKFWAPVLIALVALLGAGPRGRSGHRASWHLLPFTALLAAVLLSYNLAGGIIPRHQTHDARQPLLVFITRYVGPEDVVILEEDRVWQAAIYYRPEHRVHGLPGPLSDRDDPRHTILNAALDEARQALMTGHDLYVVESRWDEVRGLLRDDLGPLPQPEAVLEYGDWQLGAAGQRLLAVRLPRG